MAERIQNAFADQQIQFDLLAVCEFASPQGAVDWKLRCTQTALFQKGRRQTLQFRDPFRRLLTTTFGKLTIGIRSLGSRSKHEIGLFEEEWPTEWNFGGEC
jgi:hypothetical protein